MPDSNPTEESLNKIEVGIRQLKIQYDMFFAGAAPRQPFETRKELEIMIKSVGDSRMQRFADRYRFNSLASKYQSMTELWAKMIRAKEEGRLRPGIPGFVEPVRRPASEAAGAAAPTASAATSPPRRAGGAKREEFFRSRFKNPEAEDESLRMFYDRFIEAGKRNGTAAVSRVSYKVFLKQITERIRAIKDRNRCDEVTLAIILKENGVSLKADPVRAEGEEK